MKTPPLIPGWLLLAVIAAFAAALCVSLPGCATITFDYQWKQSRPVSAKPWLYVYAIDTDLACRGLGSDPHKTLERIYGCSQWKPTGCLVVLPDSAPAWLIAHEERHCEGWTH